MIWKRTGLEGNEDLLPSLPTTHIEQIRGVGFLNLNCADILGDSEGVTMEVVGELMGIGSERGILALFLQTLA